MKMPSLPPSTTLKLSEKDFMKYRAVIKKSGAWWIGWLMVHYAGRVFDAEEIVNLVDASMVLLPYRQPLC